MPADVEMLAKVPLFALLDDQERQALAEVIETRHFAAGEAIFARGDVGDALYVIHRGKIEIYVESFTGQKIALVEHEPGELFGEIALFDGGPRTATARAVEETETWVLDRDGLRDLVDRYPHAALDLLAVLGQRLRATNDLLRGQVTRNVNEEEEERLTLGQFLADRVAAFGGSWTFIGLFGLLMLFWIGLNTAILIDRPFDPYPFILLNLVLSLLAAMQAPIIMMAQNRQSDKDRLKADLDYQINLKAELEVAHLHRKFDKIYEDLQVHFGKIERELAMKSDVAVGDEKS